MKEIYHLSDVEGKEKKKRIVGLTHDSFFSMPFTTTITQRTYELAIRGAGAALRVNNVKKAGMAFLKKTQSLSSSLFQENILKGRGRRSM